MKVSGLRRRFRAKSDGVLVWQGKAGGGRPVAGALWVAIALAGCGAVGAPFTRSLPLARGARIIGAGVGGFDGGGFAGQYRYIFVAQHAISSSRLMVREADQLEHAGWTRVRTLGPDGRLEPGTRVGMPGSVSEFRSSDARLLASLAMVDDLSDAGSETENDIGVTRAVKRLAGHDGMISVTLRSDRDP